MNRMFICYLLLLTACAEENNRIAFPETMYSEVSEVFTTDIYMRYPYRIRITNSAFYIMDLHATDY
jgi:hypothetical protein